MDIIIWVLIIFLAVIVFLVLGTAWQRRSQQRAALEELREHLIGHDMITSVLAEDSPQGVPRAKTFAGRLIRFLLGGDPGYIRIDRMNYDLVTVRIGITTERVTTYNIGGISIEKSRGSSRPVEYHYIVRTVVADAGAVKARLRTKRGDRSDIVAVAWRGGRLADILNAQTELNMAIKKCFLSTDGLKLKYDRRNNVVRIIMRVRQDSVTGFDVLPFPTAEKMNVINKIAGLVRQDVSGYIL